MSVNDRRYMARSADEWDAAENFTPGDPPKSWREIARELRRRASLVLATTPADTLDELDRLSEVVHRLQMIDHNGRALDAEDEVAAIVASGDDDDPPPGLVNRIVVD